MSDSYQVATTYCDGTVVPHDHEDVEVATQEYADTLAEALTPTEGADTKHVRMVTFLVQNSGNKIKHHIDSGVFLCKHAV